MPGVIHKSPVQKVISINGEVVDVEDMEYINIHDFATFEQEEVMSQKFIKTFRRKLDSPTRESSLSRKGHMSFRQIAQQVLMKENVIMAMKHYSHRSDSESETEEEEGSQTLGSTGSVFLSCGGSPGKGINYLGSNNHLPDPSMDPPSTKCQVNNNEFPPPDTQPLADCTHTEYVDEAEEGDSNGYMGKAVSWHAEEEIKLNMPDEGRGEVTHESASHSRDRRHPRNTAGKLGKLQECPCPCVLQWACSVRGQHCLHVVSPCCIFC